MVGELYIKQFKREFSDKNEYIILNMYIALR